jgi:hypothetical protein
MTKGCDRSWQVDAVREGRLSSRDVESFERHAHACAACAGIVARDERLRALGRELPVADPGPLALKRLRARVLRDVMAAPLRARWPPRARLALVSMAAVAAMVAAFIGLRASPRTSAVTLQRAPLVDIPATLAGSVAPAVGAAWAQTRAGGIERVELRAGTLRIHVRPQRPGERFFVALPDGELEVRGTTFEVTAVDGATSHVVVDEGTVVLRLRGAAEQSLGPGTSWSAPSARGATPPAPASTAPVAPPARRRWANLREDAGDGDDGASLYVEAMRAFREGRYDRAATAFHAVTLAYPLATEAEDASFLEALSLANEGRTDAAAAAAERHLERFPRSFRRKDASILVARAASREGRCDEAIAVLAPWTGAAPEAEIRSVLAACADAGGPSR